MSIKFFVKGAVHFLSGILLFRTGAKYRSKTFRHLVLARYYMSRPEGEWDGILRDVGRVLRAKILEWNNSRLNIIDQEEARRMDNLRKEYELIPGLFDSDWRELNLPLVLTYPGKTPYDGEGLECGDNEHSDE